MSVSAVLSYILSRFAFIGTHLVFAYWLIFLFNDPLNFGKLVPSYFHIPTLDARVIDPSDSCNAFDIAAFKNNALYFLLWWVTHSGLARTKVKKALGIDEHPIERPLFAAIATVVWFINVYTWQPISNCSKFDVLRVPSLQWLAIGPILLFSTFLIVGLLWALPDHVFGTSKYKYKQHKFPEQKLIKDTFPYGLVRHPAAAGFLFWYIFLPAYTTNHLVLSAFWLSFILVGTVLFEEGGVAKEDTEFGRQYIEYRKDVHAFVPTYKSIYTVFFKPAKKEV